MTEYPNSFFLKIIISVNSLYMLNFQVAKENLFLLFCLLHHMEKNQKETELDTFWEISKAP